MDREYAFLDYHVGNLPEPTIIDVGAHIGTFAIWLLSRNPSARVISVEADPETFAIAQINASAFALGRWQVIHRAAAASDGERVRFSTNGPSMSHQVSPVGDREVETISLSGLLEQTAARVDLLKVDIEGSEEAFLCATPSLLGRVDRLVVELHPQQCDIARVRNAIHDQFDTIEEISGRTSRKPLIFACRGGGR